jgi:two-component system sensor histidine kinase KdpD
MERRPLLLGESRPSALLGVLVALGVVAAVTAVIYPLRQVMPAVSTGVIYLLAVLAISTFWGLRLGLLTSLLSATAFNFFHIPTTGHVHVAEAENWVALGAFLVAAVLASSVAELARTRANEAELRRREAVLAAEMARLLLGGRSATDALEETATRLAEALELPRARIVLAESPSSEAGAYSIPLRHGNTIMGTLTVPADSEPQVLQRLGERIVPALETLLSAAVERERLEAEAVEADALRRSDEIKTALLRAVSHDLRTPLTAIVASGDALSSASLSPAERKALSEALTGEASRLARLVDQLLDLSRLEAGAAEPRRDWCSIEEIALVATEQAGEHSQFELSLERDLPLLHADAVQLERALVNVLENAARHSGERRVSLRARAIDSRLVMRVVDRGPGIPESELERVFQPFHRSDGGSSAGHRGSGLGLAIAKGFIEANGGRIWAESRPGRGTTIVIELPVRSRSLGGQPAAAVGRVP